MSCLPCSSSGRLVLVVVVDAVVPAVKEVGQYGLIRAAHVRSGRLVPVTDTRCDLGRGMHDWNLQESLVTVAPGEVLGPDVLVRVLDSLLQRRHVGPVLPVLVPQVVAVGGSDGKGGDAATVFFSKRKRQWLAFAHVLR